MQMDCTDRGAYSTLLLIAWDQSPPGTLPDNDSVLARWTLLTADEFTQRKATVMAPFELRYDGRWHQRRMEREADKAKVICDNNRKAAGKRWESKSKANVMRAHSERNAGVVQNGGANASHDVSVSHKLNGENTSTHQEASPIKDLQTDARALRMECQSESESELYKTPLSPSKGEKKKRQSFDSRPKDFDDLKHVVVGDMGLTEDDAIALWEHWSGNGFRNNGRTMASWKHTASNWERRKIFFPSLQPQTGKLFHR
jgi:uncharacterized protein YdaU (DUF1376 family)